MKINWKVRIKNPLWIAQVQAAVALPILTYFGLTVEDMTTWGAVWDVLVKAISNPYVIGCVIVSLFNALTDPTTKGIGDSDQAMKYDKPKDEETKPEEEVK